jgi:hypothetical protein
MEKSCVQKNEEKSDSCIENHNKFWYKPAKIRPGPGAKSWRQDERCQGYAVLLRSSSFFSVLHRSSPFFTVLLRFRYKLVGTRQKFKTILTRKIKTSLSKTQADFDA